MFNAAGPWLRTKSDETPLRLLHLHSPPHTSKRHPASPASVVEKGPSPLILTSRAITTGQGTTSFTCSYTCHPLTTLVLPAQSNAPKIADSTTEENITSTTELAPLQVAPDVHVDPDSSALSTITRNLILLTLVQVKASPQWTRPHITYPPLLLAHPNPFYHQKPNFTLSLTPSHR